MSTPDKDEPGDGGTTGTPDHQLSPPSSDEDESMVVSGGGVARPSEDGSS